MGMPRSQNRSDSDENRENSPNLIRLCLDFGHSSAYLPLRYDSGSYFHEIGYWTNSCEPIGPCPPSEYFLSTCKVFARACKVFFFFFACRAGVTPESLRCSLARLKNSTPTPLRQIDFSKNSTPTPLRQIDFSKSSDSTPTPLSAQMLRRSTPEWSTPRACIQYIR